MIEQGNMVTEIRTNTAIVIAVMVLTGVFTGWLGYRIRYRGDVHLIAGYRAGAPADAEALARVIGSVVLVVAAVTVFAGLIYPTLIISPGAEVTYWFGYTAIVLILSGYAFLTSRQYDNEP
jgi:Ca2+/Na+ antiporter